MNARFERRSALRVHRLRIRLGWWGFKQEIKMLNTIKTVALSAFLGFAALSAVPATAQADGVYLNFGSRNDTRLGVYTGNGNDGVRLVRRDDRGWHRDRDWRRACSPQRALNKAEDMGLRRARVVDVNRRTVKVAGRKFNNRIVIVFGNERGCPIYSR
jgi:hypothetical protein